MQVSANEVSIEFHNTILKSNWSKPGIESTEEQLRQTTLKLIVDKNFYSLMKVKAPRAIMFGKIVCTEKNGQQTRYLLFKHNKISNFLWLIPGFFQDKKQVVCVIHYRLKRRRSIFKSVYSCVVNKNSKYLPNSKNTHKLLLFNIRVKYHRQRIERILQQSELQKDSIRNNRIEKVRVQ